ncbi:guanitoxin biosynthesis L-arginine gamma (S) hydroxylase [Sphaerospermopsis torques-reginae]|jgi:fatty acid desaturase|uniref:L-arginine gamma (S) hydroxylase n=1 Tax=Sphaerospermopsis torques-reginae ITEP-024 TaxID=984208 RepID=A0ABX8WVP2_9CYAN|nr:guanitoxin biosynthesis L-arginine gamma (S) hydroxylase [Sphaerospermopsis torques-reginae]QYX30482.1 L-arginine gamma (S) hydroxylase [Sphaerospermopsis torques-reginae ITEP-024]
MKKNIKKYRFSNSIYHQIKPLLKLDQWHCWLALAEDWIVICFAISISYYLSWYFYPVTILLIGSRQRALATLLHEAAHQVIAKNRTLNFMMGTFFSGYFILQTMSSYRKSHVEKHHRYFGNPDEDPDYKFAISQGLYQQSLDDKTFQMLYIFSPLLLAQVPKYIKSLLIHRFLEDQNYLELVAIGLWWLTIISLSILFNLWQYLILFWLIPYLTVFQIIGWFIELAEHYPLMNNDINLYMSRNRNSHFIEKFLTGMHNENYHLVHHLFPNIPFWNVPKAHEILMQDPNYAQHHSQSGGIVWSNNNAPSILSGLTQVSS